MFSLRFRSVETVKIPVTFYVNCPILFYFAVE